MDHPSGGGNNNANIPTQSAGPGARGLLAGVIDLTHCPTTKKNYTDLQNECILCQDYKEIDAFAAAYALQNLWNLPFTSPDVHDLVTEIERMRPIGGEYKTFRDYITAWIAALGKTNYAVAFMRIEGQNNVLGNQCLQVLALFLWKQFCKHNGRNDSSDAVDYYAAARLIFSWLVYSITFDNEMANRSRESGGHSADNLTRTFANALVTGKEVCKGSAVIYCAMLNGIAGKDSAKDIDGVAQFASVPRPVYSLETYSGLGHTWPAICMVPPGRRQKASLFDAWASWGKSSTSTTSKITGSVAPPAASNNVKEELPWTTNYKLVDPTWARTAQDNGMSGRIWWSFTNAAFTVSHIPTNVSTVELISLKWKPPSIDEDLIFTPKTALPFQSCMEWWTLLTPNWISERKDELYWIDVATVDPFCSPIKPAETSKSGKITVKFMNNCMHQGSRMPATWLCYFPMPFDKVVATKLQNGGKLPVASQNIAQFVQDGLSSDGRTIWKATTPVYPGTSSTEGTLSILGYFSSIRDVAPINGDREQRGPSLSDDAKKKAAADYLAIVTWKIDFK